MKHLNAGTAALLSPFLKPLCRYRSDLKCRRATKGRRVFCEVNYRRWPSSWANVSVCWALESQLEKNQKSEFVVFMGGGLDSDVLCTKDNGALAWLLSSLGLLKRLANVTSSSLVLFYRARWPLSACYPLKNLNIERDLGVGLKRCWRLSRFIGVYDLCEKNKDSIQDLCWLWQMRRAATSRVAARGDRDLVNLLDVESYFRHFIS